MCQFPRHVPRFRFVAGDDGRGPVTGFPVEGVGVVALAGLAIDVHELCRVRVVGALRIRSVTEGASTRIRPLRVQPFRDPCAMGRSCGACGFQGFDRVHWLIILVLAVVLFLTATAAVWAKRTVLSADRVVAAVDSSGAPIRSAPGPLAPLDLAGDADALDSSAVLIVAPVPRSEWRRVVSTLTTLKRVMKPAAPNQVAMCRSWPQACITGTVSPASLRRHRPASSR